jgi:ABC-type branched-subunit amino acid transport system substrate-binding protein
LGQQLLEGSTAYLDRVNRMGGIFGRQVKLIVEDDQYEPEPAVQNTNRLITQYNVFFLFDYVGTPTLTRVLPLLKYYETRKIVNVAPLTGADPQRKPPYDRYVFNVRASYEEEARALVGYLYSHGYRKLGFLGQADAFGKSGEGEVTKALAEHGLRLCGSVAYRRNQNADSSMRAQVEMLKQKGADSVIMFGVFGPCAAFIRDARLSGWSVPIANVSFVSSYALLEQLTGYHDSQRRDLTANLLASQVVPSPDQVELPLVADFVRNGPAESRRFITFEGWLNAAVVTEALKRTGPEPTREKFIDAMESLGNWDPGIGVKLQFSKTSHQGMHKVWLTVSRNGRWESVNQ